jgi:hypothetical protein
MDYPNAAAVGDRWFDRFLAAYLKVVEEYDAHVVI